MTGQTKKILLVDDDPAICNLIYRFFTHNDYHMELASDSITARKIIASFKPDLVILDINLPDGNGLSLCQEIAPTGVLVMILSCLNDTQSILDSFDKGADDYLTKPFNLEILNARINALFKRHQSAQNLSFKQPLFFDNLVLDPDNLSVVINNQSIILTRLEFKLVYFLASYPNEIWSRADLLMKIWNDDGTGDLRKVDVHIGQIRKKIYDLDSQLIKTVRGKGYLFKPPTSVVMQRISHCQA